MSKEKEMQDQQEPEQSENKEGQGNNPDALKVALNLSDEFDAHAEQMKAYHQIIDKRIEALEERVSEENEIPEKISKFISEAISEKMKKSIETTTGELVTFDNKEQIIMEAATKILLEIAVMTGPGGTVRVDTSQESVNRAAHMASQLYKAVQDSL